MTSPIEQCDKVKKMKEDFEDEIMELKNKLGVMEVRLNELEISLERK